MPRWNCRGSSGQFHQMDLSHCISWIFGPGLPNIWFLSHMQVYEIYFPPIFPSRGYILGITSTDGVIMESHTF